MAHIPDSTGGFIANKLLKIKDKQKNETVVFCSPPHYFSSRSKIDRKSIADDFALLSAPA